MSSPEQRATAILAAQRFVVIGTADADGPWTAAAQYRLIPRGLYVESDLGSRHARAIVDADGVQLAFRARQTEATEPAVREVLAARLPRDAVAGPALDDEIAAVLAVPSRRLYVLDVEAAYVFDRDAWRTRGTDARLEVDAAAVWGALAAPGSSGHAR